MPTGIYLRLKNFILDHYKRLSEQSIIYNHVIIFRFYLGHWQEGIGKLFSFGGLGVWTLVDVVMVAIRYIGPADGSLYI